MAHECIFFFSFKFDFPVWQIWLKFPGKWPTMKSRHTKASEVLLVSKKSKQQEFARHHSQEYNVKTLLPISANVMQKRTLKMQHWALMEKPVQLLNEKFIMFFDSCVEVGNTEEASLHSSMVTKTLLRWEPLDGLFPHLQAILLGQDIAMAKHRRQRRESSPKAALPLAPWRDSGLSPVSMFLQCQLLAGINFGIQWWCSSSILFFTSCTVFSFSFLADSAWSSNLQDEPFSQLGDADNVNCQTLDDGLFLLWPHKHTELCIRMILFALAYMKSICPSPKMACVANN